MNVPPLASAITGVIGGTPMVELHRLRNLLGLEGRLLVKLEYLNPGSSKKDRIALKMMQDAKIEPGQPVVELTSGNTGTGLAIVCKSMGHPFIAVMSRGNTLERARMMQALGAEVILVDQAPGSAPNQLPPRCSFHAKFVRNFRYEKDFSATVHVSRSSALLSARRTAPRCRAEGQIAKTADPTPVGAHRHRRVAGLPHRDALRGLAA